MASLKEVKGRISSVKSTRKITSAMKMVASAKLHKAQAAIENMLPYQEKMSKILVNFLRAPEESFVSPYSAEREVCKVAILVYSSNSSLCGSFNANVAKMFIRTVEEYKDLGSENIIVYPVGRKIEETVRKMGFEPRGSYQDMADKPSYQEAYDLAEELMKLYATGEVDKVEIIYHHFKSSGSQELLRETYLPIDLSKVEEESKQEQASKWRVNYIVEPSEEEFIQALLPQVLKLKVFTSLLDSAASEHATRMMSMQVATENADGLIDDLTKQYNKTRQQAITNELLDIVSGSMK